MSDIQQQVQDTIDDLVAGGAERGLQVAVFHEGEQVVGAVAGTDAAGRTIGHDTPVHAMSTGKGVVATAVHVLAEHGLLDYDLRIADVWPEFGAEGKESATLRQALVHTVGVPALPDDTTLELLTGWDAMCAAIAASKPAWEPGTRMGYHAQTFGFIVGETVRRAVGRRISDVLAEDVAGPLGVARELFFGVPSEELDRVAVLEEAPGYSETLMAMFGSPVPPTIGFLNDRVALAADIPSGGIVSARGVARMYAALLDEVDGVRLIGPDRLGKASAVQYEGQDVVVGIPTVTALGYGIGRPGEEPPRRSVIGFPGMGGSAGWADLATRTTLGLTTTRLHMGLAPALAAVTPLVTAAFG